jgi:hypothetical protein
MTKLVRMEFYLHAPILGPSLVFRNVVPQFYRFFGFLQGLISRLNLKRHDARIYGSDTFT